MFFHSIHTTHSNILQDIHPISSFLSSDDSFEFLSIFNGAGDEFDCGNVFPHSRTLVSEGERRWVGITHIPGELVLEERCEKDKFCLLK